VTSELRGTFTARLIGRAQRRRLDARSFLSLASGAMTFSSHARSDSLASPAVNHGLDGHGHHRVMLSGIEPS
jgi:hypothetical protein